MDESKSNDSQKNDISSGSALRKGGVIGAFAGALFAIAIHVYATFASIRFGDFSFYFLSFIFVIKT